MIRLRSSYLAALAAVLIAAATSASASSCYPRDVVMLIDQSGSTNKELNYIKKLSADVVEGFDVGTTGDYFDYFSLVGYTDTIKKEIGFGDVTSFKFLKKQISKLKRFNTESSSIPYALNYAIQRLKEFKREEAQQVVLIVSDGVLDIPTNPAKSVYDVCDNIDDATDLAYTSLQTCLENLVAEATESDDIIVIQIPTDDSVGTDNIFTSSTILSSYVKQATSSYGALSESCTEIPTHSPTAPTGSPTLLLDTSCYVSKKRYNGSPDSKETTSSAEECGTLCYTTDSCECFSFQTKSKENNCFLFESIPVASQNKKFISGPKYCSTVQDITDAPTPMPTDAPTDAPTPSPTPPPSMVKSTVYKKTTLSSAYSMSFDFTLDAINSESPQSVIQRGRKKNNGYVRQPAVFVDEGSSQLRFRISTSVDSNQGCETEAELELGVTYGIEVRVVEGESAGLYIDGELACSIDFVEGETLSYLENRLPIYIGSPEDFVTASGTVANLIYKDITESPTPQPTNSPTMNPTSSPTMNPTDSPTMNPTDSPTMNPTDSPTMNPTLPPSMELARVPEDVYFGSSYTITFDLTLDAYDSEIRSVIQRGEDVLAGPTYIRQPAVFLKSENKLALRLSTSATSNKACDVDAGLELDTTYQITIAVTEGESAILYINEDAACTISFDEGETLLYVGESLPLYIGSPEDFLTVSGSVESLVYKDVTDSPTMSPTDSPTPQPTPPTFGGNGGGNRG